MLPLRFGYFRLRQNNLNNGVQNSLKIPNIDITHPLRLSPPPSPTPPSRAYRELSSPQQGTASHTPYQSQQDQTAAPPPSSPDVTKTRKQLEPHYKLAFTCVPCGHRSSHTVSKQGYHHGSVLISCPSCRIRHVISDNLNIFGDRKITVEDLLREKGQLVKRGTLGEDGDIEFWEDTPAESADGASLTEGEEQDAKRLRETRDPSSSETDPVPLASVLSSDAGIRPPIQRISHQSPTPSTRRQYQTNQFSPPPMLKKGGKKPIGWINGMVWVTVPRDTNGINNEDPVAGGSRDSVQGKPQVTRDASVTTVPATAESSPEVKPLIRRIEVMQVPRVRRVQARFLFKGPRLVPVDEGRRISVQVQPGVVSSHRPPGGIPVEEDEPPRPGFRRPSSLPLVPNCLSQS
ncbi:hypothetical protein CIB48_g2865 [Xylaria polymorpha]|nr:hypothetical protein CIB48_g2865 [Xylaria polymorpha]